MELAKKEDAGAVANFVGAVVRLPTRGLYAAYSTVNALIFGEKGKSVVTVQLLASCLSWEIINSIRQWWKGEITGKRCVKNIIDCGVVVASGIGGGIGGNMIGATVGSLFGPIGAACGAFVGAAAGGVLSVMAAETLCDKLTRWVFGLPKYVALENAFKFLGLSHNASNGDVNTQYRHLALQFHPDKGGDKDMWTRLQYSLEIIRESRGTM